MSNKSKKFLSDEAIGLLMDIKDEKGLSWEQLADEIGIDNTILSRLKKKSRGLTEEYLIKIKRYLSKYTKAIQVELTAGGDQYSNIGDKNRINVSSDDKEIEIMEREIKFLREAKDFYQTKCASLEAENKKLQKIIDELKK